MSPIPSPDTPPLFAARTRQFCRRADELIGDPSLTQAGAAAALLHLARLQGDLATERLRQTAPAKAELHRLEAPLQAQEAALKQARAALSEALMHAIPDPANLYGPVAHGNQPDAAINRREDTTPAPPQAVSASRALLDLEALRPYLSEVALRQAIERHNKDTRSHALTGVAYAVLPPAAHLPCAVF